MHRSGYTFFKRYCNLLLIKKRICVKYICMADSISITGALPWRVSTKPTSIKGQAQATYDSSQTATEHSHTTLRALQARWRMFYSSKSEAIKTT